MEVGSTAILQIKQYIGYDVEVVSEYGKHICYKGNVSFFKHFWTLMVPSLCFAFVLLIMTLRKTAQHIHERISMHLPMCMGIGGHMWVILTRDSLLYYVGWFALYFLTIVLWVAAPLDLWNLPLAWTVVWHTAAGTHMILNLSQASHLTQSHYTLTVIS